MKRTLSTAILLILMSVFTVAQAHHTEAPTKYFGVTEIDRGEGVFALEWSYGHSASEWAGMIAEFKRRHPDLEVLSHSVMANLHGISFDGVVIITVPKNRCPQ